MWNLKCVVNFQTELPFCFSGKCSFTPISIAVWQNVLVCMSRFFFLCCAFQKTAVHAVGWNFGVRCISYKPTELFHFPPMMEKESRGNTECIFTFKVTAFRIRCLSLLWTGAGFNNLLWKLCLPGQSSLAFYLFRGLSTSRFAPAADRSAQPLESEPFN